MPEFHVTICEKITEERTYTVEADNPREAAEMAAHEWLVKGIDPGPNVEVTERDYEVYAESDNGFDFLEHFSTEIETEEAER